MANIGAATGSQVLNGLQWVSNPATPSTASTIYKHGKTHTQLVQHYTNYYHLWNAQAEKARLKCAADPNNAEAIQREKWATYYSTNSAALSHYHLGICQGGAVPVQRAQSPPAPPSAAQTPAATQQRLHALPQQHARESAETSGGGGNRANKRKRQRRLARERAEAREAAGREEREREAAERGEGERVQRETAEREERERIRREAERAEREEREAIEAAAAAQLNSATRISSLEAALEKRLIEEAKDIKDTEEKLRNRKRSFQETIQSMPPDAQSRINLDNETSTTTTSTSSDNSNNTCVICHDGVSTMAVIPCGHVCLCNRCSDVCMSGQHQNGQRQRSCPLCRGNMQSVLRIYLGN